jgi:hypothetical protein
MAAVSELSKLRKNFHTGCSFSLLFPHGLARRKEEFAPSESGWRPNRIVRQPLHFNRRFPNQPEKPYCA